MIKEALRYPQGVDSTRPWYEDMQGKGGSYPVVAFDENGYEIPEFTGEYHDVRVKILARAPKGAKFFHSIWGLKGLEKQEVSRKDW